MNENAYSGAELLDFLTHAGERGLMPLPTARALAVASRRVIGILDDEEQADLRRLDLSAVLRRFGNKRAKDFNPTSLKEYGRRFQRALELFTQWREEPAAFSPRTRSTAQSRNRNKRAEGVDPFPMASADGTASLPTGRDAFGFETKFPIRPGVVITLANIPTDLAKAEAERLAQFIRMLALD